MISRILLLFAMAAGLIPDAHSQWRVYSGPDMNSQAVTTWLSDKSGNFWVGTTGGIAVFSEKERVNVNRIEDAAQKNAESIGHVEKIWEDKSGNIWIVSTGKLFIFNGEIWIRVNDQDYEGYTVKYLLVDSQGSTWICSEFREFNKYAGVQSKPHIYGTVVRFDGVQWFNFGGEIGDEVYVQPGNPEEFYTGLLEDRRGYIWIGSVTGLNVFAKTEWIQVKEETLPGCYITDLTLDKTGNVWISTAGGVARFDGKGWEVYKKSDGLGGNNVRKIACDVDGNIWAFIYGGISFQGVSCYQQKGWRWFKGGKDIPEGEIINSPDDFLESGCWMTRDGFAFFDGNNFIRPGMEGGIEGDRYYALETDTAGNIYLATEKGLFQGDGRSFAPLLKPVSGTWEVTDILYDRQDRIWIATTDPVIYQISSSKTDQYSIQDGLPQEAARAFTEDAAGRIWVIYRKSLALFEF